MRLWPECVELWYLNCVQSILLHFWPTDWVEPMPRAVRLSVCLSVTKVSPGQTAERIEMKLGTDVCPGQTSIVLDGDPSPPREGGKWVGEI